MGLYVKEKEILEQNLTLNEVSLLKKVLRGSDSLINHEQLLEKLVRIYSEKPFGGEMPYTVQKAETQTPDEWLEDRLSKVYEGELK